MKAMKILKTAAGALVCTVLLAHTVPAEARDQETILETNVASAYTLTIPRSQSIEYGKNVTDIGLLSVTGNIRTDETLQVSVEKTAFRNEEKDHEFSFELLSGEEAFSGQSWTEEELDTVQSVPLSVSISETVWDEVQAGSYTAALTFTARIR